MLTRTRGRRPRNRRQPSSAGFTLPELMAVVLIASILLVIALPAYRDQVRKMRRGEAFEAIARIQQAQEQRRAEQPRYASQLSSGGLNLPAVTPSGRYQLSSGTPEGQAHQAYWVSATAQGDQAQDLPCSHLRVDVNGAGMVQRSGADASLSNTADDNRRCWGDR